MGAVSATAPDIADFEHHRRELTAYCYRMLGSPFEAEDAVQDTLLRAWRGRDRFEGRAAVRSWLYRIAHQRVLRRARGRPAPRAADGSRPGGRADRRELRVLPEVTWIEPLPTPEDAVDAGESVRLALVAALAPSAAAPARRLILCEVLHFKASEAADLLDTTVASVNSALQRARATLDGADLSLDAGSAEAPDPELLARYVDAFERYDIDELTALIHEDATQSMPPYDLWLRGRDDVFSWWFGPGAGCRGSRVVPAAAPANGRPRSGSTSRARAAPGTSRGRCRSSRCATA